MGAPDGEVAATVARGNAMADATLAASKRPAAESQESTGIDGLVSWLWIPICGISEAGQSAVFIALSWHRSPCPGFQQVSLFSL